MVIDFGRTADDYARHRPGFPEVLFQRLAQLGIGQPGQCCVDVGTGTGAIARRLAIGGCQVAACDIAPELLAAARRLDAAAGVRVGHRQAPAEATGLPAGSWDAVTAGQCWHWFDRPRATAEAWRLLVPGGALVICHMDYLTGTGGVAAASEELVHRHNPHWEMIGGGGIREGWASELLAVGFSELQGFAFDDCVEFTHESWRGRMRTCNGVGAQLEPSQVAAFDRDLATLLDRRYPGPVLRIPHRISALIARRSG